MKNKLFLYDLEKIKEEIYWTKGINYQPHINIPNIEGIYINKEDFPELEENKLTTHDAKLYYDKTKNKVYYEYIEKQLINEQAIQDKKIAVLEKQVADLYFMQLQGGTN